MRDLYFCGDIHGKFRELIFKATQKYKIEHSDIIVLGDFGVGFHKQEYYVQEYNRVLKKLEKYDLNIHVLRGNHDDPSYFTDKPKLDFPRLHFLVDHKVYEICGRKLYIVGGANSTDIVCGDFKRTEGVDWWRDEDIKRIPVSDLPNKVDIILSHSAPISFEPVVKRFEETPLYQYEKILEERKYLSEILKNVVADYWFYGHYHHYYSGSYGELLYRCLPELEFYLAPEPKNHNPQGKEEKDGTKK